MNCVEGLKIKEKKDKICICESCIVGKVHMQLFSHKHKHTNSILNIIVSNLDYLNTISFSGAKWLIV